MRVLITGNQGFVGRHFMSILGQEDIVGVDIVGDNPQDCRDWFKEHDEYFDLVIHLAAIVGGREKIENDPLSVATDLSIDSEFFNWIVRNKPGKTIYFSSSAAYPISLQTRDADRCLYEGDISLRNISTPDMTYGWSKLTGEFLAQFARDQGCKIWIFRPFSGYGEDQDITYPFPIFIDRALRREDPFPIWGDGTQIRDFIHMDDIVRGCMEIVTNHAPMTVNMATGRHTSFITLAELIFNELGWRPSNFDFKLDKPVGVHNRVGSPVKMLRYFQPQIELEEGIRRALCAREHNTTIQTKN